MYFMSMFIFVCCGCHAQVSGVNDTASYVKDVDRLGDLIEEKGHEIDRLANLIANSTDHMEEDIERNGQAIDSPTANRLIEEGGQWVEAVSDVMDREVEKRGSLVEAQVTGTKHNIILADGESVESSGENPIDAISRKVDEQGNRVEKIGKDIEDNTRSIIPRYLKNRVHGLRQKNTLYRRYVNDAPLKRSDMDTDGERGAKVIVPVQKKKLEKLLLFYYMKNKYPGYVDHLLEQAENISPQTSTENLKSMLEDLSKDGGRNTSLAEDLQKYILPKLDVTSINQEERIDKAMSNLIGKEIKGESGNGITAKTDKDLNVDLIEDRKGKIQDESRRNEDASERDETVKERDEEKKRTKLQEYLGKEQPGKSRAGCKNGVKCAVKELIGLLDKMYFNNYSPGENSVITEGTGDTRSKSDPYATIGHAAKQHIHEHNEQHLEDSMHHIEHEDHHFKEHFHNPHVGHTNTHHEEDDEEQESHHEGEQSTSEKEGNMLDESAELEHMIHSIPDLHSVNFGDNVHNSVPHQFQILHHNEEVQQEREKEEEKESERLHMEALRNQKQEEREREHHESKHNGKLNSHHHHLGYNLHRLHYLHRFDGHHGVETGIHHLHDDRKHDEHVSGGEFNQGVAPSSKSHRATPVSGSSRSMDAYKPYEYHDDDDDGDDHHDHHDDHKHKITSQHKRLHRVHKHLHHSDNPIVHIDHDDEYDEDPGENIHNTHEMLLSQGSHVAVHENPYVEYDNDDRIPIPDVVHEGPISTVPVFDEHFRGPGIHDTSDVHFEEEMDVGHYRKKRSVPSIPNQVSDHAFVKRGDPYASIGHYPENHMDIGGLDHEYVEEGHHCGSYGWDPSPEHHEDQHSNGEHHGCGGEHMGEVHGFGYGHHGRRHEEHDDHDDHEDHHGNHFGGHFSGGYGSHGRRHRGFVNRHVGFSFGNDHEVIHNFHENSYRRHHNKESDGEEDGEYGEDDHGDHGHHIHEPNPEPNHFNDHIHPAIPHLYEQVEHEPWVYGNYGHHGHLHNHHHDYEDHKHATHHHHPEPEPEHQDDHDHDEHRIVHIGFEHGDSDKRDETNISHDEKMLKNRIGRNVRKKRWYDEDDEDDDDDDDGFEYEHDFNERRHNTPHNYFAGDRIDGNGHDVADLSYLTEKYGRDMTHHIAEGAEQVEAVGDEIEQQVNDEINDVTHVGYDVEAPDYDHRGHFYPNVHEEDVQHDVDRVFPHLTQRQLINMVRDDSYRRQYNFPRRHLHLHHDKDSRNGED